MVGAIAAVKNVAVVVSEVGVSEVAKNAAAVAIGAAVTAAATAAVFAVVPR